MSRCQRTGSFGPAAAGGWCWGALALAAALALASAGAAAACGPLPGTYPAYAGDKLATGNNNTVFNGTAAVAVAKGNFTASGIRPDTGAIEAATPGLPSIEPAWPSFSSSTDVVTPPAIASGTYRNVTANNGAALAGNFMMSRLTIANNASVTLAGDFFLDRLDIGNNVTVTASGPVRLYVKTDLDIKNNSQLNAAGAVANLQIYLYSGADASLSGATLTGVIYGEGTARVDMQDSTITGAIVTAGEIQVGNNNRFNFDAATQAAIGAISTCTGIVAEFRMDEAGWNGSGGEVTDSSGRNLHGTRVTTALPTTTTTVNPAPAIPATVGSFCRAGEFDGNAVLRAPASQLFNLSSQFSATMWVYPTAYPGADLMSIMSNDQNYELHLNPAGRVFWWWGGGARSLTSTQSLPLNAWSHVAITFRDGTPASQVIYINGVARGSGATAGLLNPNPCPFHVGGDVNTGSCALIPGRNFRGRIDEVRVYNTALSAAQVTSIMNTGRACAGVASFLIGVQAGTASTCAPSNVTITARDAQGNTLSSYTGTITLGTSHGRGDWAKVTAGGALDNGAANDGNASYTFVAADNGAVTLSLANAVAADVSVNVVDASVPSSASTSAAIAFRDNAVVVATDESAAFNAANPIASLVAGRAHRMRLELWTKNNAGLCSLLPFSRAGVTTKLWLATDASHPGAAILPSAALASNCAAPLGPLATSKAAAGTLAMTFANGVAGFYLCSSDVGKYGLNAAIEPPGQVDAAVTILDGASSTLTARPFILAVHQIRAGALDNPNGAAATDPKFAIAGALFGMTVGGYRWAAAADADSDGQADAGASFAQASGTGLAPAFAGSASFRATLNTPFPGVSGSLKAGVATVAIAGGTGSLADLYYTEVGSFHLTGAVGTGKAVTNYLGSAGVDLRPIVFNAAGVQNDVVGRFVPAEFRLSSVSRTHRSGIAAADLAACGGSSFTYLGEPFAAQFVLKAHASSPGAPVTANYEGSYARLVLDAPSLKFDVVNGAATSLATKLTVSCGAACGTWAAGSATVNASVVVARGVSAACTAAEKPEGPYDAAVLGLSPQDPDGVVLQLPHDFDRLADGSLDGRQLASVPLRFGRLHLASAVGSERLDLAVPLTAQYWNGVGFITNAADNCTRLAPTNVKLQGYSPASYAAAVPQTNVQFASPFTAAGIGSLRLAKPVTAEKGSLRLCLDLDPGAAGDVSCQAATPANRNFLQEYASCGSYIRDPAATVGFGLYKPPSNFIHFRENF